MKVAVVKAGELVSPHYGQAEGFVLVEIDGGRVQSRSMVPAPSEHSCGGLAQLFMQHGVDTVIVGGIGGGAVQHLNAAGVNIIAGASGNIEDVLSSYVEGTLVPGDAVCGGHGQSGGCQHD